MLTDIEEARFWEKIDKLGADDCWPWVAKSRHRFGYGIVTVTRDGRQRQYTASRIACALRNGEPPQPQLHALHSCDNPVCCNPRHLRWGTPRENRHDALERGRDSKPPKNYPGRHAGKMPKGSGVHNQTLTEAAVRQIWALHLARHNVSEIAAVTGAKKHVVADVVRGRSWRHLEGAPTIEALKAGGARRGSNGFNELAMRRALEVRKARA